MHNFSSIEKIIQQSKPFLKRKFRVRKIGVFGSFARGENNPESDIDVLVEFEETPDYFVLAALQNYLSRKFKQKVDIVTAPALKPILAKEILREVRYV